MKKIPLVLTVLFAISSFPCHAEDPRLDSGRLKDPSLIRCYLFQEGARGRVKQLAGNGEGDLFLANNTLYREPFIGSGRSKWLGLQEGAIGVKWGRGRYPGTFSIRPGNFTKSVVHSRFYTTPAGSFSMEAWVRPREGTGALLWSGGSALENGGFGLADDGKNLTWTVVTKMGPVKIDGPSLKRDLWHQVVCTWNEETRTSQLFVDGVLAGERQGDAPFLPSPPEKPSGFENPEDDYEGLRVGGNQGRGTLFFDLDELLIFSRILPVSEIATAFAAGKPKGSEEELLAAYKREKQEEETTESLELSIPKDSFGYFTVGSAIPMTFRIPAGAPLAGKHTAIWTVQDVHSRTVQEGKLELSATPEEGGMKTVSLKLEDCGLYFLQMEIRDEKDRLLCGVEYPIGVIVSLPPPGQRPLSSPLGAHAAIDRWPEATVLGVSYFRPIGWWEQMEPRPGAYNFEYNDQMVDEAVKRKMEIMFCLNGIPAFADDPEAGDTFPEGGKRTMEQYRSFLTALVRHYRGKVKYWEIINETNADSARLGSGTPQRARRYVEILKTACEVIKKEAPECKVVGICGCPGFVPWTEAVLAAGGGPYFDILSVHNYRVFPIAESARERNIANVRDVLKRYGKDCPVWSTEFGVHQPRRINGRPMPRETLLRLYATRLGGSKGNEYAAIDMPLVPEAQAADWTIQSWLLDLANGVQRFFMLMGPNRFTPEINDSEGTPSEMGVAFAAMASVIMPMEKAELLPLDSLCDAGVVIFQKDGKRDVVLFSEDQPELVFKAPGTKVLHGMDWLGNPWSQKAGDDGLLRLRAGSHPLYLLDVPEEFSPVSLIRIDAEDGAGRTRGKIVVNNPGSKDIAWRLAVEAPKGIKVDFPATVEVAAQGKTEVPFVLHAESISRGTHEIVFTATDGEGAVVARTQHMFESLDAIIPMPRMKEPIPFRAHPEDWKEIKGISIQDESFVLSGKPVQGVPWAPQWRGPDDLSFTYRLAWDPAEGIAILAEVTDDQFRPAPNEKRDVMFRYDCLEVFLDTRPVSMRRDAYSTGVEQILVRPSDAEEPLPCLIQTKSGDASPYDARFISRRTKTGYIIEGRIKPKAGAVWKAEAGLPFALDLMLDDADKDLRKTIMGIGFGGNDNAISTKRWGWFQLAP